MIRYIIDNYTKESGVRNLTRLLMMLITKIVANKDSFTISIEEVLKYLDNKNCEEDINAINMSGIVNALAYTPYGGKTLQIECSMYKGEDDIIVTGCLGDVLKESIKVAISYIKEKEYVSATSFYNNVIHIHLLDASTKKEGPSSGVAVTTSILSKLLDVIVSDKIAFTGEISLKGRILKVGGIKEKLISAYNNGIKTVYIPSSNQKDLFEVPAEITDKLEIKLVDNYDTIYDDIFRKTGL